MLIGICGSKCAGKSTVAQYLIDHHGFKKLRLEDETAVHKNGISSGTTDSAMPQQHGTQTPDAVSKLGRGQSYQQQHSFATVASLLDHVTKHWRSRWVTTDIHNEAVLDALSRRPFFILLSVDAPLTVRWQRYKQRRQQQQASSTSLETFVSESDAHLYDPVNGVLPLVSRAAIRLLNTSSDLAHLYATLGKLDLTNQDRLRPSWDSYFMQLASLAAQRCNCMKRAVGCVLVDGTKRTVISTGYNGTPRHLRNCGDGGCPRCNSGDSASGVALGTCLCLHAEENALLEAGRERIREGSVLYCNTCPCLTCSIKIVQVGIGEVVYNQGYSMDTETAEVFRSAGVRLRQFSPPANGLIHLEKMELY
ncbi:cytidine deaminase-like protein [Microdochium trichocladiopsis]|uniref:Deoxycytidylate deaminase n=1 Tax=Microdochium trichocladiopsis TaxID=1682393 RepID=A0A9P8Y147_9PEZI|nr:cytidine deaminase-like protein [Microdochium trichocladiopsis]KAH7026131.1 cytidine deaminase-like protein [Microdochium trichocladiopsis]